MASLINALSRVREVDIPILLCVPGLIEGLISNVLPPLAKVFFFRTLFAGDGPFVEQLFHEWAQSATHGLVQEALAALVKTRIWRKQIEKNEAHYYFCADAQAKFIQRLTNWDANVPVCASVKPRHLWVYARARWAHFEKTCVAPNADTRSIRLIRDLVKMLKQHVGDNSLWKWLMKSRQEQLWDLFVMYFEAHDYLPSAMMTMASLMPLKLGETLPQERVQCRSLPFLEHIGILMQTQEDVFAITPLCIALFRSDVDIAVTRDDLSEMPSTCFVAEGDALLGFDEMCGGIIVESNFRVFVYTSEIILHQIISRFCAVENEIGGALLIATLTVDSVLRALQANITAKDIIAFLETHRHKQAAAIPTNVKLQLNLWEQDRFRLQSEKATLFQWSAADYARPDGQRLFQACFAAAGDGILWARTWNQVSVFGTGGIEDPDKECKDVTISRADSSLTIDALKRTYLRHFIDAGKSLRLISSGRVLRDDQTLAKIPNLSPEGTIIVIVRDGTGTSGSSKIVVPPAMLSLGSIIVSGGVLSFAWKRNTSRSQSVTQFYFLVASIWLYVFLTFGLPALCEACRAPARWLKAWNSELARKRSAVVLPSPSKDLSADSNVATPLLESRSNDDAVAASIPSS